ncbi:hypothetical protein TNIN_251601 [Trichonephila inaurata madagascariensis]|uniref:Uncharacterized protein n=1 Tax=Trichonephila inaurata madagascariensis TaxID=2747483 RepID=A0A8X6YRP3_9ARAC|nr:hypothetical protein TNIN_251601 [Trichonephila inaurata madagascariensis]
MENKKDEQKPNKKAGGVGGKRVSSNNNCYYTMRRNFSNLSALSVLPIHLIRTKKEKMIEGKEMQVKDAFCICKKKRNRKKERQSDQSWRLKREMLQEIITIASQKESSVLRFGNAE